MPRNLILVGYMGAGKSSVGRELAALLGWRFVDLDQEIERTSAAAVAEVFAREGEAEFRKLETDAIARIAGSTRTVLAAGGGALVTPGNLELLSALGPIIKLEAPALELWRRVRGSARPLAATRRRFLARLAARRRLYRDLPYRVSTGRLSPKEVAEEIAARFVGTVRQLPVLLGERSYDIVIAAGALSQAGSLLRQVLKPGRCLVVSHQRLLTWYGPALVSSLRAAGWQPTCHAIPEGETSKSLEMALMLYQALADQGLERSEPVVALGGGVVGDLAGFVAATYLRGVPFVQLPTTLLAQIDSSVGGKVAVNLQAGKNLVGAFYQPAMVLIDPCALATLDPLEFNSGLAELIKYGVILDEQLFASIENNLPAIKARRLEVLVPLIARACELKTQVVTADERELGLRRILNFGHTLGHAIEKVAGFGGIRHGQAIAIGMVFASQLSAKLGICSQEVPRRLAALLAQAGLPTETDLDLALLLAAASNDKKVEGGQLTWILPERIGAVRTWRGEVPRA